MAGITGIENEELYWETLMNSQSLSSGLGAATGIYLVGPEGAAIGGALGEPVWDGIIVVSNGINDSLNYIVGSEIFPIFGNFGATWSDGTPVQRSTRSTRSYQKYQTRNSFPNSDTLPLYQRLKGKPAMIKLHYHDGQSRQDDPYMAEVYYYNVNDSSCFNSSA